MNKYTEQTKLSAVEDYCSGNAGLKVVSHRHGVDASSLRKWVAAFRVHGIAGIQNKKKKHYSAAFKLNVLQRMRDEELSYRQAGALFDIRKFDIIGQWKRRYDEGGLDALSQQPGSGLHKQMPKLTPPTEIESSGEKLDYTPGVFTVEQHVRGKWACRECETLTQAPVPAQVIDKGIPTAGLLAYVMVAKFADHLPLYRQEKIFGRAGLAISRSTLAQWVGQTGVQLQPLVDSLREIVLAQGVIHADETLVQMIAPVTKQASSKASPKSAAWLTPAASSSTCTRRTKANCLSRHCTQLAGCTKSSGKRGK